jgi:hypothetical protein
MGGFVSLLNRKTSGGASAWRTANMVCLASGSCKKLRHKFDFSIEPLLEDLGEIDLSGIAWVIVGGESGLGARPMKREWVVSIRRQCREQKVLFFFKQWVVCARKKTADCSIKELMTNIREESQLRYRNAQTACDMRRSFWSLTG